MMTAILKVSAAFGLAVSEKETGTLLMRVPENPRKPGERLPPSPPKLGFEAAGQNYGQFREFR